MPLVPRNHFDEMERFFDRFFDEFAAPEARAVPALIRPSMDVYETEKNVVAEVEVPGIDPKKVEVNIEDNVLTVEGGEEQTDEQKDEERGYLRKEIRRGHFKRSAMLPAEVKADKAKAEYKDGVMTVTMPKVQPKKEKQQTVDVQVK